MSKVVTKHGSKFNYTNTVYKGFNRHIEVDCRVHGTITIKAVNHLHSEHGCPQCGQKARVASKTKSLEQFMEEANNCHNGKYDYSKTKYKGDKYSIDIICPTHGVFTQNASSHLQSRGCPKCAMDKRTAAASANPTGWGYSDWETAGRTSKWFDSYKVYIIECWNDTEHFIKVGRTFMKVSKRFDCHKSMPYEYKVLEIIEGTPRYICEAEKKLQDLNTDIKYTPAIDFKGKQECFNIVGFRTK